MLFRKSYLLIIISSLIFGCTKTEKLSGKVQVDGSSTVFPITEAVAEEFNKEHPRVRVTVGVSGTGGGFKKFVKGEIDINDASRKIKGKEKTLAVENQIAFVELPVASDGITLVVNPQNTWVKSFTKEQLVKLWQPGSQVKKWNQLDSSWPNEEIKLYGPGPDSGTFDFFTKAVNGKSGASRSDYTKSEDDNVLVQGVAGDKNALGFFGYAYYEENKEKLKPIPVVSLATKEPILPSLESIQTKTYDLLSRDVFIYVSDKALSRPEVKKFVNFYMSNVASLAKEVGYVDLSKEAYMAAEKNLQSFSAKK